MNVEVNVLQKDDPDQPNHVIVDIEVDKKVKNRVKEIIIHGNKALSFNQINGNEKPMIIIGVTFQNQKFVREEYEKTKSL